MKNKDKYTVVLNGLQFGFDDGVGAINFVEVANSHFIPGEYVKTLDTIVRFNKSEKEERNNDND